MSILSPLLVGSGSSAGPGLARYADPFTGNGFVKSGREVIPEYMPMETKGQVASIGQDEIWEITDTGTQRLVAVYDGVSKTWMPVG